MFTNTLTTITVDEVEKLKVVARPQYLSSVYEWGVIEPIILTNYKKKLHIIAGRRRVASWLEARALAIKNGVLDDKPHLHELNAVIYDNVDPKNQAAMAYIENEQRSENIVGAWEMMREAQRRGDWEQVAKIASINKGYEKQLEKLNDLNPTLIQGYKDGKVAKGNLYECTKLGATRQQYLVEIMQAKGKVTGTDIKAAKVATAKAVLATMPMIPGTPRAAVVNTKTKYATIPDNGTAVVIFDDFNQAFEHAQANDTGLYRLVRIK